jgi:ribosome-binding factor A
MMKRMERVDELLTQELSELIQEEAEELGMVSVIAVRTTPDLSQAEILVRSVDRDSGDLAKELQRRAYSYQSVLGKKLVLRRVPRLTFTAEQQPERADRIEEIFHELDREKDQS